MAKSVGGDSLESFSRLVNLGSVSGSLTWDIATGSGMNDVPSEKIVELIELVLEIS